MNKETKIIIIRNTSVFDSHFIVKECSDRFRCVGEEGRFECMLILVLNRNVERIWQKVV